MKRVGLTAKAWGRAPSDYFPELGTWEKFCIDEAVAYVLAVTQEENKNNGKTVQEKGSLWSLLTNEKFKAKK